MFCTYTHNYFHVSYEFQVKNYVQHDSRFIIIYDLQNKTKCSMCFKMLKNIKASKCPGTSSTDLPKPKINKIDVPITQFLSFIIALRYKIITKLLWKKYKATYKIRK